MMNMSYPENLVLAVFDAKTEADIWPDGNPPQDLLAAVEYSISQLGSRNQDILHARFRDGQTLAEIGTRFGVTAERIRQVEARSIRQMRTFAEPLLIGMDAYIQKQVDAAVEQAAMKNSVATQQIIAERNREIKKLKLEHSQDVQLLAELVKGIESGEPIAVPMQVAKDEAHREEPLSVLGLSERTYNALRRAGYVNVIDVVLAGTQIQRASHIGPKSYHEITERLREHGYAVNTPGENLKG